MSEALSLLLAQQSQACPPSSVPLDAVAILGATIIDAPDVFLEAARAIQVNGALLNVRQDGQVEIRTAAGSVNLRLNAPIASGREVLEPLLNVGDGKKTLAVLIQPPKGAAPRSVALIVPAAESSVLEKTAAPLPLEAPIPITVGKRLSLMPLPDGAEVPDPVAQAEKAAAVLAGQTEDVLKTMPTLARPAVQKGLEAFFLKSQAAESVSPQGHQAKTLHALEVTRLIPPGKTWPDDVPPGQLRAVVTDVTQSGHVLLDVEGKSFFVRETNRLPVGAKMLVMPVHEDLAQTPLSSLPSDQHWPALRELVLAAMQAEPQGARSFVQAKLPSPAGSMAATTLFFLSAIQAGKLDEWLGAGTAAALTRAGKKAAATAFLEEAEAAVRTASDTRAGEWKAWPLPLHFGDAFHMLRLYVRHGDDALARGEAGPDRQQRNKKAHFVISVDLSRLGPVQVEGFSRPQRLDIVLRSERPLPDVLACAIKGDYLRTMEALNLSGTLGFQTGRRDWIVFEDTPRLPPRMA